MGKKDSKLLLPACVYKCKCYDGKYKDTDY